MNPGASINGAIRKYLYKQTGLRDYMGENPLPFSAEVKDCDWETMTPK